MKCLVFAPVFLLVAACAAPPEQKVSDASQRPCDLIFRTGSNVPVRDCVDQPKQSEGEKARTMELLREPIKPRTQPATAGG